MTEERKKIPHTFAARVLGPMTVVLDKLFNRITFVCSLCALAMFALTAYKLYQGQDVEVIEGLVLIPALILGAGVILKRLYVSTAFRYKVTMPARWVTIDYGQGLVHQEVRTLVERILTAPLFSSEKPIFRVHDLRQNSMSFDPILEICFGGEHEFLAIWKDGTVIAIASDQTST